MAHFAQLDENNIVIQVIVVDNENILLNGSESEQAGINFLSSLGLGDKWIQTSYSGKIRGKFAGHGDVYNSERDIFVSQEASITDYEAPWQGLIQPTSPSIMLDSVPRCGNRWLNSVVNSAFPTAFQRWGYLHRHNHETFYNSLNKFDTIVSILRNPLDSLASSLYTFSYTNDEAIIIDIQGTINILKEIKNNKENILLLTFEEITQNVNSVLQKISSRINLDPLPVDENLVREKLEKDSFGTFYSVPINNTEQINECKTTLLQEKFKPYMDEANSLYNELIEYKKS